MRATTRPHYHHGSLREALISASIELIKTDGIGAVSLRRVAREAGVSSGAPYHHFADRSALLAAIVIQGHDILATQFHAAANAAQDPSSALSSYLETYVRFANEHRGHIHVMLRPELFDAPSHPEAASAGSGAIDLLTQLVDSYLTAGSIPDKDPATLVNTIWALSVGIVTLWIDGPLEARCVQQDTTPEALTAHIGQLVTSLLEHASNRPGFPGGSQTSGG